MVSTSVFAYCAKQFRESTRKAAGVEPATCPPVNAKTFFPKTLEGHQLLYFDLHGRPGDNFWYGDDHIVALTADQLRKTNLRGTVVFALNCFLADEYSPMLDALLDAGVDFVIGGDGENFAGTELLLGAALLGQWFRRLLRWVGPLRALTLAKSRVRLDLRKDRFFGRGDRVQAAQDTLDFKAYYRRIEIT